MLNQHFGALSCLVSAIKIYTTTLIETHRKALNYKTDVVDITNGSK